MSKLENLKGIKFGRLLVVERDLTTKRTKWICKCECGKIKSIQATHLKSGATTSCGCYQKEKASRANNIHGYSGTSLHHRWKAILQRCTNPKAKAYKNYGARGITICEEWIDFNNFLKWSLENGYSEELELDRIDNDKGYYPSNCRWCSVLVNNHNRRITAKIEGIPLRDFSTMYNLKYEHVHYIYYRLKNKKIDITKNNIMKYANQLPIIKET